MKSHILSVVAICLCSSGVQAAERRYPFEQIELKNGMGVITLEDHSCPIAAVQVWYHVGSKNEEPGRQGFAHMFEHMMFRGTDRLSETAHFDNIRRVGGDCNAYTAFDQTVYVEELPANQLELALWLESERMAFLKIDKKGFETERKVVEEELRQPHNRPYGRVPERLLGDLFGEHCYGWTPGGQISHLRQAKVEEVSAFWDKYYAPNNATLVVVGDVKHAEVQELARKYFEWIPPCPQPGRPNCEIEQPKKSRTIKLPEDKGPLPVLGVVYHTVPESHPDQLPLEILMGALGGGESSRLYVDIVKDKKIAQVAIGGAFAFEGGGIAGAGGVLLPFGNKSKLMKAIKSHIKDVREKGITEAELEKMKNQQRRQEVMGAMTVASKAGLLGQYAVLYGDAERINRRLEEIDAVTLDDVKRVAKQYLSKDSAINISIEPSASGMIGSLFGKGKDAKDDPDNKPPVEDDGTNRTAQRTGPKAKAKRPEGFPTEPPSAKALDALPDMSHTDKTLSNGLRVVVVSNHEVPSVSLTLGIKSGAWSEAKPGVANAAMSMLTKGTQSRDSKKLADLLESNAISLNGSASMDDSQVRASSLLPTLDLASELMRDVIENPTFPKDEFDIMTKQMKVGLMISTKTPEYLADREYRRLLYGDHPYSRTVTGEMEDVDKLAIDDLQAWWGENLRPENAVLYIAGDITPSAAFELAVKHFASWKVDREFSPPRLAAIPAKRETHIYIYDRPGSVQSQIRVGHIGLRRIDDAYPTARVMATILGGGFNSRLNKAIRVDKGLTYGARGSISPQRFAGSFNMSTFTKTPTTGETVQTLLDVVKRMRSEKPEAQELADTKTYIVGSFPGDRETPQAVAGDLWMIENEGLSNDYFQQYLSAVQKTTTNDVLKAAKEQVDLNHLIIVVVGEAAKIKEDLEKIAPVTVLNQDSQDKGDDKDGEGGKDDEKSVTMKS